MKTMYDLLDIRKDQLQRRCEKFLIFSELLAELLHQDNNQSAEQKSTGTQLSTESDKPDKKKLPVEISLASIGTRPNGYSLSRILNLGVGVEIEVEKVPEDVMPHLDWWEAKRDGSLRNEGIEFVSSFGMRVGHLSEPLQKLCKIMNASRASIGTFEFSERTSVHVHLDVRKLGPEEIKSLLLVYTIFEDSLFKFAGEHRKNNIFCVPVRYLAMSDLCYDGVRWGNFLHNWKKYCALNLLRVTDFGTVEFRHMEGNSNYERIMLWVLLLGSLIDYCRTRPAEAVMEEIKRLKYISHYHEYTKAVFGPFASLIGIDPVEFDFAVSDAKMFFNLITTGDH